MVRRLKRTYPQALVARIVEQQMRLTPDDGELYQNATRCVQNAIDIAEEYTGVAICKAELVVGYNAPRKLMELRISPIEKVSGISYRTADGWELFDMSLCEVTANNKQCVIELDSLPELSSPSRLENFRINITVGYDDTDELLPVSEGHLSMPGAIEAAIQLTAATLFNSDGDVVIGRLVSELPIGARQLLEPYRILPYGA